MILIACVDDHGGLAFNHRRQSSDSVVRDRILELSDGGKLWMNHYSAKQFDQGEAPQINVDDAFLSEAAQGEFCFVEDTSPAEYERWIEKIILFKWNRVYPQDVALGLDLTNWTLQSSGDFAGHSHEKITVEVYVR